MRVDWSTYHVFRQLSIDDEPSTLGTYTASDATGELPYSREGVLPSLVSMVWSKTCIGRRNGNGCGGYGVLNHHRASVNAKIKALKRPRLKIRECSRTRKCCPRAATFPNSTLETIQTEHFCIRRGGIGVECY